MDSSSPPYALSESVGAESPERVVDFETASSNAAADMLDEIYSESLQELLTDIRREVLPLGKTMVNILDEFLIEKEKPLRRGDVLEIQGPSGSHKTHLVYQLLATCVLPSLHRGVSLGGWGAAAVVFDSDGTFDARRFADLLRLRITASLQTHHVSIPPDALQDIIDSCMTRVPIFRPESSNQLAASILSLENFLATDSVMRHTEMLMLVVDSLSAFYWSDRFTSEQLRQGVQDHVSATTTNPLSHVVTALERIRASHAPLILVTNWALSQTEPLTGETPDQEIPVYKQHLYPFIKLQEPGDHEESTTFDAAEDAPASSVASTTNAQDDLRPHTDPHAKRIPCLSVQHHISLGLATHSHLVAPEVLSPTIREVQPTGASGTQSGGAIAGLVWSVKAPRYGRFYLLTDGHSLEAQFIHP